MVILINGANLEWQVFFPVSEKRFLVEQLERRWSSRAVCHHIPLSMSGISDRSTPLTYSVMLSSHLESHVFICQAIAHTILHTVGF